MFVGVGDAAVVLFFEFVLRRAGGGVAAEPELFDEVLALSVGGEPVERAALFVGDDVGDVFVEPFPVGGGERGRRRLLRLRRLRLGDEDRRRGLANCRRRRWRGLGRWRLRFGGPGG
jgi:hypothetical protein